MGVFDKLLRNGRSALFIATRFKVGKRGLDDTSKIKTVMRKESFILRVDESKSSMLGDALDIYDLFKVFQLNGGG